MKRRENIIIIVVLVVMVIAIVGVSYAAFNYSRTGSINSITTGAITMTYKETDNTISLTGALPTTDKTGMVRLNPGEYFDFSISSEITGDVNINYEISAKKEDGNTIDGKYIKLYLTRIKDDGTEDGLMSPETYNEETTANDYTGRPANEMSLYTSSMNSSESNNYRLRMYVDEGYNPQGDGGGLTFTIQINVYGKAGDKYVPETTKTILAANEVQEEKTNMFNYNSSGDIITDSKELTIENNPEYITNGLYSAEDEDGTSYYFRGNVDNNNVQFGEYTSDYYVYNNGYGNYYQTLESCQEANPRFTCSPVKLASAGDKMYWKIVRVNGDGSLRLIYNGTSTNPDYSDLVHSNKVGNSKYNLNNNDPKYTGYTYDRDTNETDSFIKREVDTWYKNTLGSISTYDGKVLGGRFCSDSSGYKDAEDYGFVDDYWYETGDMLYASVDRLEQFITNYAKANSPTLKCPSTSESYGGSYRLKVGLLTADEAVLSGVSTKLDSYNYLNPETTAGFISMTPANSSSLWRIINALNDSDVNNGGNIRPVINISIDTDFVSGDGTATNPYVIE